MLFGRDREKRAIDELVASARAGRGGALLLRGGLGSGKTALLDYAAERGDGMTRLRVTGVRMEADLPYAALHLLLRPLLPGIDGLPEPQAAALRSAFGLADGLSNRFLVGLATLSLLAERAETEPVLCLVDDARLLDLPSFEALLFAARRLAADRVALLFATSWGAVPDREPAPRVEGVTELELPALDRPACEALLDELGIADRGFRDRLITVTDGNPLALRELAPERGRDFDTGDRDGHWAARLQRLFTADYESLPPDVRELLLIAAAEGTGDVEVILRVAEELGVAASALAGAERTGYVAVTGDRLAFRQTLVRSAVYLSGPKARKRVIHEALAGVFDGEDDADRRAWHAAAGVAGPDDAAADELAASARRAVARGGQAAAVDILHRAALLSTRPEVKAERAIAAAEAAGDGGRHDRIPDLVRFAGSFDLDPSQASRLAELRAEEELLYGSVPSAREILTGAVGPVAEADPGRAVIMVTHLVNAAIHWGETAWVAEAVELMNTLGFATEPGDPGDHTDDGDPRRLIAAAAAACTGIREVLAGDSRRGTELVRAMVNPMRPLRSGMVGARAFAATLAGLVADDDVTAELIEPLLTECRASGMVGWLPTLHSELAPALTRLGRFRDARASAAEGIRIATELGQTRMAACLSATRTVLAAVAGEPVAAQPGELSPWATATWRHGLALAALADGDYVVARDLWESIVDTSAAVTVAAWAWAPDHVEAAVRAGDRDSAVAARQVFARWADGGRRADLAATLRRCDALLAPDTEAAARYEAAVESHVTAGGATRPGTITAAPDEAPASAAAVAGASRLFDAARTQLLYGEWLRRNRDRAVARRRLRQAAAEFDRLGATAWSRRARLELRATGETRATRAARPDLRDRLTPQELQVVKLAATGATNRDIGAQLFLSPRTVGHHLYKAFPKLGVANRAELARLFADERA